MEKKQSSIISAAVKQLDIPGELRIDNNWYSFEDIIKENIGHWLKRRKLAAVTPGLFYTIQDLNVNK